MSLIFFEVLIFAGKFCASTLKRQICKLVFIWRSQKQKYKSARCFKNVLYPVFITYL